MVRGGAVCLSGGATARQFGCAISVLWLAQQRQLVHGAVGGRAPALQPCCAGAHVHIK